MVVQSFLKWSETAGVSDRCRATLALTRIYAQEHMDGKDRQDAEAALSLLLEDPSPKVRLALAEGLAEIDHAPRNIVLALAADQLEVAARVIALSRVLSDNDLIEIIASGRSSLQQLVAFRRPLSVSVAAALAEIADADAIAGMLDNPEVSIARISLRRIAERFGDNAELRARLFDRADLPSDVRQGLMEQLGAALAGSMFVRSAIGGTRGRKVAEDACTTATLRLAETVVQDEIPALVEHLRLSGKLTPAFLMHALCAGNVDFFAGAVVSLSGLSDGRVRGILVDGRETAMRALYRSIGLGRDLAPVFVTATQMWRAASRTHSSLDTDLVATQLMARHAGDADRQPAVAELLRLVETMQFSWRRHVSRDYAQALAAQAA
ncbi:DUF2336 domain-containing protein [Hoeflea sp. YIM 152468]|uniref:DUF2336 domain-containing protein n=1 Tax=Hoeflea sp. YIM 152468 TaxID=3031759 RepID=UPI0023DC27A3|nr:DUF2336 domain-containing protein [Hoeflea sp. YIM 152468]MDF1609999.1 DUF2336 domain-containing protein [Hoeflea sp. YIM 152468]